MMADTTELDSESLRNLIREKYPDRNYGQIAKEVGVTYPTIKKLLDGGRITNTTIRLIAANLNYERKEEKKERPSIQRETQREQPQNPIFSLIRKIEDDTLARELILYVQFTGITMVEDISRYARVYYTRNGVSEALVSALEVRLREDYRQTWGKEETPRIETKREEVSREREKRQDLGSRVEYQPKPLEKSTIHSDGRRRASGAPPESIFSKLYLK